MKPITAKLVLALNPKIPRATAEVTAQKLEKACDQFGINTPLRKAHFLGQLTAESGLVPKEEVLYYSAKRMTEVWPLRFPTVESARPYAMNPQRLANKVYSGRLGNGDEASGDGYRYRGMGMIQLTGKSNYKTYGQMTGFNLLQNPDLLLQIGVSALVAAAYWKARNLNEAADRNDIYSVTRGVNGGHHGIETRKWAFNVAYQSLK